VTNVSAAEIKTALLLGYILHRMETRYHYY